MGKIRGSQGSWEAEVTYPDGRKEVLPCVHDYWWRREPSGQFYNDPWTPELRKTAKFAKHVELIKSSRRVILTTNKIDKSKNRGEGFFERTGYVGIFGIDDFILNDEGMRFRFTDRIANAR